MPNIIEQQDLLKGLPDTRLAMLLQNPVADIPPFLVAAEAQRRQAIRQQFSASSPQESVVDSLTKQIANVPQNIQSSAQTPPNVPPTPQMQGVMALQQQQAIQQAAQQPQQMRAGGHVQRYQVGGTVQQTGKVQPWWTIPDISGTIPNVTGWIGSKVSDLASAITTPYSEMKEEREAEDTFDPKLPDVDLTKVNIDAKDKVPLTPSRDTGKKDTSPENKSKSIPEATVEDDEIRSRLEELYGSQEPSSWEKAQRWFAMAEQFYDPSKTTGQSIAGAGRAFAEMTGEQSRAMRDAELEKKKALLQYDVSELERQRSAAAEQARREYEAAVKLNERKTLSAGDAVDGLTSTLRTLNDQIKSLDEDVTLDPEAKTAAKAQIMRQIETVQMQMAGIMKQSGYGGAGIITMDQLKRMAAGQQ